MSSYLRQSQNLSVAINVPWPVGMLFGPRAKMPNVICLSPTLLCDPNDVICVYVLFSA